MLNKVISNCFLYSTSSIILRASSIFLFPVFSFYLTKADYGILLVTQSLTVFITSLSNFETEKTLTRFLHNDDFTRKKVLGNIIITGFTSNTIILVVLLLFGNKILPYFLNDIPFYPYMFYSILCIFFTYLVSIYSSYLKATQKGKNSFVFDISYSATNIVLNLFFVAVLKYNVIGLIYSTILSGALFSVIAFLKIKNVSSFNFDKKIIKSIIIYSAPLIPYIWLGIGIETVSTIFLNVEQGKEISGIYYIAVTFCSIFSTIKGSIVLAITPWFFQFYKTKTKFIKKVFIDIIIFTAIIGFGISAFSYEILSALSSKYEFIEAWKYIPIISLGFLIVFIGELVNLPIYYEKEKTKFLILANLGGLILTLVLSYLLTFKFGINGTIIARTSGYLLMTIIMIIISKKAIGFQLNYFVISLVVLSSLVFFHLNFLPINYLLLLVIKLFTTLIILICFFRYILKKYYLTKKIYITYTSKIFKIFSIKQL